MVDIIEYSIYAGKCGVIQLFKCCSIERETISLFANGMHYLLEDK